VQSGTALLNNANSPTADRAALFKVWWAARSYGEVMPIMQDLLAEGYGFDQSEEGETGPMTLVIAISPSPQWIIVAADGMGYVEQGNAAMPYRADKLGAVPTTNWVMGFAGAVTLAGLKAALDVKLTSGEVKLDRRFEIGALEYISELSRLGTANNTSVLLAGFDGNNQPRVSVSSPFPATPCPQSTIATVGAQQATARWILATLSPACSTLEDYERLAYFTIWQIRDLKIGRPETGYPIGLAVLTPNQPPAYIQPAFHEEMPRWLEHLQSAFRQCLETNGP